MGLALLTGAVIAFGIATPLLTWLHPVAGSADVVAVDVWVHQVRFIGAGMIGAAALWTLATLIAPLRGGLANRRSPPPARAAAPRRSRSRSRISRSVSSRLGTLALMVPVCILLWRFLEQGPLASLALPVTAGSGAVRAGRRPAC